MPGQLREILERSKNRIPGLVLLVGSTFWKAISFLANVDFIVSIHDWHLQQVANFLLGQGWIFLAFIGFVMAFWPNPKAHRRAIGSYGMQCASSGVVIGALFGALAIANSHAEPHPVMANWGPTKTGCFAIINTAQIEKAREKYDLILLCGYRDSHVDEFRNPDIAVSGPFTITGGPTDIQATFRDPDFDVAARRGVLWFRSAIVPRGTNISDVKTLEDVAKVGGKLFE